MWPVLQVAAWRPRPAVSGCASANASACSLDCLGIRAKPRIEQGSPRGFLRPPPAALLYQFRRLPPLPKPPVPLPDTHPPRRMHLRELLVVAIDARRARQRPAHHARQMVSLGIVPANMHDLPPGLPWPSPAVVLASPGRWPSHGPHPACRAVSPAPVVAGHADCRSHRPPSKELNVTGQPAAAARAKQTWRRRHLNAHH